MEYATLENLPAPQFKRACGVNRSTFAAMVEELRESLDRSGKRGGQNRLSVENQLLIALQYWREYRTQFHISLDFGVSEATVCRVIGRVETTLVRSARFSLPGKRRLLDPESEYESVALDASEVEVERPKKNSETATAARRSGIRSKLKSSLT